MSHHWSILKAVPIAGEPGAELRDFDTLSSADQDMCLAALLAEWTDRFGEPDVETDTYKVVFYIDSSSIAGAALVYNVEVLSETETAAFIVGDVLATSTVPGLAYAVESLGTIEAEPIDPTNPFKRLSIVIRP